MSASLPPAGDEPEEMEKFSFPPEQQNGQMRSMIGCNCLAELPAGDEPVAAETPVKVYIL